MAYSSESVSHWFSRARELILFVGALASCLSWAIELLIGGIPYEQFSWGIGLLSAVVCYTAFLLSRFSMPERTRSSALIFYLPVITLAVALPVDVGVSIRFAFGPASVS